MAQIQQHRWMQPKREVISADKVIEERSEKKSEYNEQLLRLMQNLGIDQKKTVEVSCQIVYQIYVCIS